MEGISFITPVTSHDILSYAPVKMNIFPIGSSSLKYFLAMQAGGGRKIPYLAVIHRLDQPVEGILVFGKTPEAAKSLSAQITAGKIEKIYLAVTYGQQAENGKKETVLEDYLKKDGKSNTSSVVNANTPGAKKARLSYEVLGEALKEIS